MRKFLSFLIAGIIILGFSPRGLAAIPYDQGVRPMEFYGGARSLGMGKAGAANFGYPEALLANPALLGYSQGISLTTGKEHSLLFSVAYPLDYYSNWGFSLAQTNWINFDSGHGVLAGYASNVIVLSYGTRLEDVAWLSDLNLPERSSFGVSFKTLLTQNLQVAGRVDRSCGSLSSLDFGLFTMPADDLAYAVVLENLVANSAFNWSDGGSSNLIPGLKAGASSRGLLKDALISVDLGYGFDGRVLMSLGLERKYSSRLRLRTGYAYQDSKGEITFGLGYILGPEARIELAASSGALPGSNGITFSFIYSPAEWVLEAKLPPEKPVAVTKKGAGGKPEKVVVVKKQRVVREDKIIERELPPELVEVPEKIKLRLASGQLEVISPAKNFETYDENVLVTGEAGEGVTIQVNNNDVVIADDGTFGALVPLRTGKNVISVDKTYKGRKKTVYLKILRRAKVIFAEGKKLEETVGVRISAEEEKLNKKEETLVARLEAPRKLEEKKKKIEAEMKKKKTEEARKRLLAEQRRLEKERQKALREKERLEEERKKIAEEKKRLQARKEKYEKQKSLIQERKEKIETLVTLGVIEVPEDEEFEIEKKITRGELATWIVKAAAIPLPEVKRDVFSDVPINHPQAPYIKVITDLGIMQAFSDGTFRPAEWVPETEGQKIFEQLGAVR